MSYYVNNKELVSFWGAMENLPWEIRKEGYITIYLSGGRFHYGEKMKLSIMETSSYTFGLICRLAVQAGYGISFGLSIWNRKDHYFEVVAPRLRKWKPRIERLPE